MLHVNYKDALKEKKKKKKQGDGMKGKNLNWSHFVLSLI
jgi:hypothetical protein